MVQTRSQLEHLSQDKLIDGLMSIEDISSKLVNLTTWFDGFTGRFEILSSELTVSKNCNRLLSERIIQLERNTVSNAQYHRCELIEINAVPASISNEKLEENICKVLSLSNRSWSYSRWYSSMSSSEKKRRLWLENSNPGNRNEKSLLTGKIFAINQKTLVN